MNLPRLRSFEQIANPAQHPRAARYLVESEADQQKDKGGLSGIRSRDKVFTKTLSFRLMTSRDGGHRKHNSRKFIELARHCR